MVVLKNELLLLLFTGGIAFSNCNPPKDTKDKLQCNDVTPDSSELITVPDVKLKDKNHKSLIVDKHKSYLLR